MQKCVPEKTHCWHGYIGLESKAVKRGKTMIQCCHCKRLHEIEDSDAAYRSWIREAKSQLPFELVYPEFAGKVAQ